MTGNSSSLHVHLLFFHIKINPLTMLYHYTMLFLPPWLNRLVPVASLWGILLLLFCLFSLTRISELYFILPVHHIEIQSPLNPMDSTWMSLLQPHVRP